MRIVFIITGLSVGGAEMMLYKIMQRIDRDKFYPFVVSLMDKGILGSRIEALGIPVIALGMERGFPSLFKFLNLIKILHKIRPDIVHTWMYHSDLIGGLAARMAGCKKVIWCIRHSNLSKNENKRSTLWVVKLCALLSKFVPTQIISCSQRANEIHAENGYVKEKLHVIPNGFDLANFQPDETRRASMRIELGLPMDVPLVGLIARFDVQKNHLGFIEAAAKVHVKMPFVHFVLAGAGVDISNVKLNSAIAEKGLPRCMHLLGRREDVPQLMASLDVLASSSHGEAFPNVLGEAMACGIPCVVTDVGDSAEIVGSTGVVVAAGDMDGLAQGLMHVLSLPLEKKKLLQEDARARVADRYEINCIVHLYETFYVRVLENQF